MQLTRALGAFCLLTMAAVAQEFRANLQGIITDPSLAAVPSAAVILKNVETGIESVTASDPAGHYLFSYLPPGSYSMTAQTLLQHCRLCAAGRFHFRQRQSRYRDCAIAGDE
jgi:hypothetical protein